MMESHRENLLWIAIVTKILNGDIGIMLSVIFAGIIFPLALAATGRIAEEFFKDPSSFIRTLQNNSSANCFTVEDKGGLLLKINTCTGSVEKLDIK